MLVQLLRHANLYFFIFAKLLRGRIWGVASTRMYTLKPGAFSIYPKISVVTGTIVDPTLYGKLSEKKKQTTFGGAPL